MNTSEGQPIYRELVCGENISYVLNENTLFSSTEYKVLRSQRIDCFLPCCQMQLNGKIQLFYLTDNCVPLRRVVQECATDTLLTIVEDLIKAVIAVIKNGFLAFQNICISLNRIYVEQDTNRVHLVYMPLNTRLFPDPAQFYRAFYGVLRRITDLRPELNANLSVFINDNLLEPEQLLEQMFRSSGKTTDRPPETNNVRNDRALTLIAVKAPYPLELHVTGDEYFVGRNESVVNGFVPFSRMVGRVHCKICRVDGDYFVMDLDSSNGTYLNKSKNRLLPNRMYPIKDGDVLRLANTYFRVCVR